MSGMHKPEQDWESCFYCARQRVSSLQSQVEFLRQTVQQRDDLIARLNVKLAGSAKYEDPDPEVSLQTQDDLHVLVRDLAEKIKQHDEILQIGIVIRNGIESHVNTLTASVTLLEKKVDNEHRQFASDHRELVERVEEIDAYIGALGSRVGNLEINSTTTMEIIENARRENKI